MSDRPAVVEIRDLVVGYGEVDAVRGAVLELSGSEILALLGPSGCGKTTLLRAIAGFERPASGTVRLCGEPVCGDRVWVEPEKRNVGMVFQDGALFPHLTVFDNVLYGVRGRAGARDRAAEVLAQVGLGDLGDRFPDQLSGGQQQRVALARALAPRPRIVLLDEPFASLDAGLREQVRAEVRSILESAGIAAVLVTHDQEEALGFADRVAVMLDGRIRQIGSPEEIYGRPESLEVALFLGDGRLFPCEVASGRLESAFGRARCRAQDGSGRVFLRPEDLILHRDGTAGAPGVVVSRRFFGHDVLEKVELESGERLEVRLLSFLASPVGSRVRVSLRDRLYQVFPETSSD